MSREEYIEKYKDIAIRQMKEYGIPASIILAQACLESGNGNSELAIKANNHFGIKCHNWDGKSFIYDDDKKMNVLGNTNVQRTHLKITQNFYEQVKGIVHFLS
jgi:Muramidase (flagellum-specific)